MFDPTPRTPGKGTLGRMRQGLRLMRQRGPDQVQFWLLALGIGLQRLVSLL